ncbi:hypothetical protein HPB50_025753 [Hyalomma asiaticum]|uniref:Uncharacterized protein n=1 Tax=Hyalomma asiaticum TaxID=266040 RepID=A0ACB7SVG4_HYAAI|nr:hypothetical protein HPB50_025753 [Hyalomma asiaticum]
MSSEKFEDLEEDFVSLMDEIRRKLENAKGRGGVGENKKSLLREVQRKVDQASSVLQELEQEARAAPNPYRVHMNSKTRKVSRGIGRCEQDGSIPVRRCHARHHCKARPVESVQRSR